VQAQIHGDQLRVIGKNCDDLPAAMAALKGAELGLPLQFQYSRD